MVYNSFPLVLSAESVISVYILDAHSLVSWRPSSKSRFFLKEGRIIFTIIETAFRHWLTAHFEFLKHSSLARCWKSDNELIGHKGFNFLSFFLEKEFGCSKPNYLLQEFAGSSLKVSRRKIRKQIMYASGW